MIFFLSQLQGFAIFLFNDKSSLTTSKSGADVPRGSIFEVVRTIMTSFLVS
jgi:hypothetical protein